MRYIRFCFVALAVLIPAMTAAADYEWYYGAGLELKRLEADCCATKHPLNVSLTGGLSLGNQLAIELDFSDTVDSGEFAGIDMDVQTASAYVAYRSAGRVYYKFKFGAVRGRLKVANLDPDGDGMAYGAGVGVDLNSGHRLEFEYTVEDFVDQGSVNTIRGSYLF